MKERIKAIEEKGKVIYKSTRSEEVFCVFYQKKSGGV